METEDLPSSFISLSGVDLLDGKSVIKKENETRVSHMTHYQRVQIMWADVHCITCTDIGEFQ